ncbi:MAG TPA: sigma-70 family RNA polymerase sigma factor, partial [Holophagaceae bacterium]|nr:sigma-70 family RNA polymerase sigma factor [Holophagaceae bacterium]
EQRLGRSASREELAAEMDLTVEDLQRLMDELEGPGDPLSEPGLDETAEGLAGLLPDLDTEDAHAQIETREREELVQRAVEALPRKERFVIQLYSFADLTMKEIGTLLNLTESRVSQLHAQAMENLRKELEGQG